MRHIEHELERKWSNRIFFGSIFLAFMMIFRIFAEPVQAKGEMGRLKNILIEEGIGTVKEEVYENKLFFAKDNPNNSATEFIIHHEGFSSVPYPDLGGKHSIGFGQPANNIKSISRKDAKQYVSDVVKQIQKNYSEHFEGLTFNEKIVLIDVIYNCHPNNISYIAKQMRIEDKDFERQELSYALRSLQFSKGIKYGGLVKRYNARIALLFN